MIPGSAVAAHAIGDAALRALATEWGGPAAVALRAAAWRRPRRDMPRLPIRKP